MERIHLRVHDAMLTRRDGLTQAKVARQVGMSRDALSRALSGQRNFSAPELAELSKMLEVSLDWLISGAPAIDGTTRLHRHHPTEILAFPVDAYREVRLSTPAVPRLEAGIDIETAANAAVEKLSDALGREFVRDLPAAIEAAYGIGVFVLSQEQLFDARAMHSGEINYIMVRATGSWYQGNLVLARELGVLLCGRDTETGSNGVIAAGWAKRFADALLMPEAYIREINWDRQTPRELAGFLWNMGVSAQTLMRRLDALSVPRGPALVHADEGTLQLLLWQYPGALKNHRVGAYRGPRIPADLFAAHLAGMRQGLVDGSSLAWLLDTPLTDL